jgi:uncharacterized membrane protein (UPF0127 family)
MRCRFLFVVMAPRAICGSMRMAPRLTWAKSAASATLSVVLAAGCSRTPAEEFPTRVGGEASTTVAPAAPSAVLAPPSASANQLAGRCIKPTPAAAPPAVPPGPAAGCPADPEGGPPKVPVVRVGFADASIRLDAELVSSEHDTARGLMYRRSMADDRGMLFDLRVKSDHQFWMHNTCIPLDLLYIDDDGLVVGIVENAPTLDDTSRGVGCPSRYVLEVNAGWTRKHGVKAGQFVKLPAEVR